MAAQTGHRKLHRYSPVSCISKSEFWNCHWFAVQGLQTENNKASAFWQRAYHGVCNWCEGLIMAYFSNGTEGFVRRLFAAFFVFWMYSRQVMVKNWLKHKRLTRAGYTMIPLQIRDKCCIFRPDPCFLIIAIVRRHREQDNTCRKTWNHYRF